MARSLRPYPQVSLEDLVLYNVLQCGPSTDHCGTPTHNLTLPTVSASTYLELREKFITSLMSSGHASVTPLTTSTLIPSGPSAAAALTFSLLNNVVSGYLSGHTSSMNLCYSVSIYGILFKS
ncbi:hypothetical protein GWI33_009316 [Rhynchophorus ferrugineus]|uniref:Uncharacterized protein n=1 Tax=Rhynchophorus ferrugineus TaxID=354439 RepID=A0A834IGT0_RHYFE|nr:hypothetical protein GWI33_009316 [Rhynchophorus ferrugineus]